VSNVLLKDENNRLKEALINEKKKRQRGKPLLLEPAPEYNGGAQFWSPQKVQEARERQAQKDAEAEALQHQKMEDQQRRISEKAEKARMLEERKRMRATAKEIRLQAQAQKAAEREAAKARRQSTQHQAKASKKGKGKQKITTPASSSGRDEVDDEESDVEVGDPTPARSSRTRQINLPTRFRT
jgi:hypothetical protein